MESKVFVLLHGAWHGGWVWDDVVEGLRQRGYEVLAPTLPGHFSTDDRRGITFQEYADFLLGEIRSLRQKVILVGHSSAGLLIQQIAHLLVDQLGGIVINNGFLVPSGKCQFDLVPKEVAEGMVAAAEARPDLCVPVLESFIREMLMAGETEADIRRLLEKLVPQPLCLFTTPVQAPGLQALEVSKGYIFCTGDRSLPPGAYLGMAKELGDFDLIEVSGGHETLFTHPERIVSALVQWSTRDQKKV